MTTTTERYTAEQMHSLAFNQERCKQDVSLALQQAATDATRLQSLKAENARLREALKRIESLDDDKRGASHSGDIARNALKED